MQLVFCVNLQKLPEFCLNCRLSFSFGMDVRINERVSDWCRLGVVNLS